VFVTCFISIKCFFYIALKNICRLEAERERRKAEADAEAAEWKRKEKEDKDRSMRGAVVLTC
jgi:hypothetical protein